MIVRELKPEDISRCSFAGEPHHLAFVEDLLLRQANEETWIDVCLMGVFLENKEVAVCVGGLNMMKNPPEIWMLATDPNYRKQGHATLLIRELEDLAKQNSFDKVCLAVEPENFEAIKLYDKLGYEHSKTYRDKWFDLEEGTEIRVKVLAKQLTNSE